MIRRTRVVPAFRHCVQNKATLTILLRQRTRRVLPLGSWGRIMVALRGRLLGSVGALALVVGATGALAGGLAVREQSASSQGASFAGASAGGDLSSTFWNPAAATIAPNGLSTESHYSLIVPDVTVKSNSVSVLQGPTGSLYAPSTTLTGDSMNMDRPVIVSASYGAYRLNQHLVLGISMNSPFGLANETDNQTWSGQRHFRSAKLFTVNATPMLAYQVAPGISIGAGVQIQYASLRFKSNPSGALAGAQDSATIEGDDYGFGYTLGLMLNPWAGGTIGFGYRSAVSHNIEGSISQNSGYLSTGIAGLQPFTPFLFQADLTTPEIANLSLRQSLTSNTRLLASAEWTRWSRVDKIDFVSMSRGGLLNVAATPANTLLNRFDFHWNDGWMFSLGGEYDWSPKLTLRGGVAYEISPIQDADQRKVNITDSDRIWASIGATYKWSQSTSFDFAYSHVFFDSAPINALTTSPASAATPVRQFIGSADQSADIISVSMKTKW